MSPDVITDWARTCFRFAMVQQPTRTSLGIAGGVVVGLLVDIFKPVLTAINVSALTDLRLAIAGAFFANVPVLFKKNRLPESIEQEFAVIRLAVSEGRLSQAHQKLLYQKLAQKVIEKATISRALEEGDLPSGKVAQPRASKRSPS